MSTEPRFEPVFHGDQDDWDNAPQEWKDHLTKAMLHAAGQGPHPGKYAGPPMQRREHDDAPYPYPNESDLAHQRFMEQGPAQPPQQPGAPPIQEAVQQPVQQQKKKAGGSKPTGTTPAALGSAAVKPQEPEGNF